MSYRGYKVLAVIPARGGSKGIPRKNLCKIAGISLVGHAALTAKSLTWIDHTVLSTEDQEIAEEGKRFNLDVPFLRPVELATDDASSLEMWKHAWLNAENYYTDCFDISILLEPTSPLRKPEDVEKTIKALVEHNSDAAATVSVTPAHFTPNKCLMIDDQGFISFFLKDGAAFSARQRIPKYYHRNGVCYAVKRETLVERGKIIEENCRAVVIDRPVVNIDEMEELEYAEYLYNRAFEKHKTF